MFILKGIDQLTNAIAKAKKIRPRVEFGSFGHYRVSGSKGFYTVICRKDERGIKTVACTCKGAEKGLVCYQRRVCVIFAHRTRQTATNGITTKGLGKAQTFLSLSFNPFWKRNYQQ